MRCKALLRYLIVGLFIPLLANAESVVGNGGDAVVCRDSNQQINSVQSLDYYEAKFINGLSLDLGASSLSAADKVKVGLSRLAKVDAFRAKKYEQALGYFFDNVAYLPGVSMTDIPDSQHLAFPLGCAVEQVAIRRAQPMPGEKVFLINKSLWDHMDSDNRAALILHEVTYADLFDGGAQDSKLARWFNGTLMSGSVARQTAAAYAKIWNETRLNIDVSYRGAPFKPGSYSVSESGIVSLQLSHPYPVLVNGQKIEISDSDSLNPVTIYPNGSLRSFKYFSKIVFDAHGSKLEFPRGGIFRLDEEGRLEKVFKDSNHTLDVDFVGAIFSYKKLENLSVSDEGFGVTGYRFTYCRSGNCTDYQDFTMSTSTYYDTERSPAKVFSSGAIKQAMFQRTIQEFDANGTVIKSTPSPF